MKTLLFSLLTIMTLFSANDLQSKPQLSKKLEVHFKKNRSYLPKSELKFHEEGDVIRGNTTLFISPKAPDKKVKFETILSNKSFFQRMVWQVSRTPFPENAYANDPLTPPNLITSREIDSNLFEIDFDRIIAKLKYPPVTHSSDSRAVAINNNGVTSQAIKQNQSASPFIFKPMGQIKTGDGLMIYANAMELNVNIPLYVRVVPISIDKNRAKPVVVGLPSDALEVIWGKNKDQNIDMSTFDISESIKYDLKLVEFKFSPYRFIKNWPSGCTETPRDEGDSFPGNVLSAISDGYNWASNTFDRMVYYVTAVYGLYEQLAGVVNLETAAIIFDQTLSEIGIPPNLQNAYSIYEEGADYLAIQMVDKIPEPGPGDYGDEFYRKSQLTWDKMKAKVNSDMKEMVVDVSRKIYHKSVQDAVYCQGRTEAPYLIIKIRNNSNKTYTDLSFELTDDEDLFTPMNIPLAEIHAKETVSIPVFYLDNPNLKIKYRSQLPDWDNTTALNNWWDEFYDNDFTFTLRGPRYKRCYKKYNGCNITTQRLYESPDRNWFDGKAFQYTKR